MQDLRKLDDGFEIDGKKFFFEDVHSIKYNRSRIRHIGTVNANMANDELNIFIKGAYKPIKVRSLSIIYIAYLSEKSSKEKSVIIEDFYDHIYKNTVIAISRDYETRLNSSSGLKYDCITLHSNGDVSYDGGSFNLRSSAPECFLSYPYLEFKVGAGSSVGKSLLRAIKGNLTLDLQVDVTADTNVFLAILKNHFGYSF